MGVLGGVLAGELAPVGELVLVVLVVVAGEAAVVLGPLGLHPASTESTASTAAPAAPSTVERGAGEAVDIERAAAAGPVPHCWVKATPHAEATSFSCVSVTSSSPPSAVTSPTRCACSSQSSS